MNYYEHHIGDYAEATGHLTFVEDAAYSRCIRKYYAREKPLPADVKEVQRLVGARTKEEKNAVDRVLSEFFSLTPDGWRKDRCDRDIEKYLAGEPEREAKKANEETRLKRHREERAALFLALTNAGQHAQWNISIKELRAMVAALPASATETRTATTATRPATAPATPATATQTPDTNHQTPDTKELISGGANTTSSASDDAPPLDHPANARLPDDSGEGFDLPGDYGAPRAAPLPMRETSPVADDPALQLSIRMRRLGVNALFTHPDVIDLSKGEIPDHVLAEGVRIARERKPNRSIPVGYLRPILEELLNPPAAKPRAPAPTGDTRFHLGAIDRSGDARAAEESLARRGITVPDGEIKF